ncbi:MAG: DUF1207 domain-containing protein [Thermoguttaceae bacterium]
MVQRALRVVQIALIVGAMVWVGPRQAVAQGLAARDATTAYPSTYPSTNTQVYPATDRAAYPSTSDQTSFGPLGPSSPYADALPGISSGVDAGNGIGAAPASSLPAADPLYAPYGSPEATSASRSFARNGGVDRSLLGDEPWSWQLMPTGLMYKSYLAGWREPRLGMQIAHDAKEGWLWDSTLGGRVGLLRYGTDSELWPEGWQLDIEGASFIRMTLDPDHDRDVQAIDFRAGMPLTRRVGPWEMKLAYVHYCSHIGDEYMLSHPGFTRINYVRETLVFGLAAYLNPDFRVYSEAGWAFRVDGEAQPWEFQFGIDWSPAEPTNRWGAPFLAVNAHLRQENDFGGNLTVRTGWQWRGTSGHLFRIGMHYFNGLSEFGEFYNTYEEQIGFGIWYDF